MYKLPAEIAEMHLIESLFGFSPDNNSGAGEVAFLLALIAIPFLLALRKLVLRHNSGEKDNSCAKRDAQST
jgi:hypothetical protein